MTELCARCQERLGELLQWEAEHPATAALASSSPQPAPPAPAPPAAPARPRSASASASVDSPAAPIVARFVPGAAPAEAAPTLAEVESVQAEATPEELRELWQHAHSCPDCSRDLALLRSARQVLAALPQHSPPPDLRQRIRAQISPSSATLAHAISDSAPAGALEPSGVRREAAPPAPGANGSRPWWSLGKSGGALPVGEASAGAPLRARGARLPRAVWAGGGAVVAAFCLLLALQIKPRTQFGDVSETDSSRSSAPAPGAPAPAQDSQKAPDKAPSTSTSPSASQASPKQSATAAKPQEKPPAVGLGAAPPSGASPSNAARPPAPRPDAAAAPNVALEPPLPQMPSIPAPPALAPRPERPRANRRVEESPRPPALSRSGERQDASGTEAATPVVGRERAAAIRIVVAPAPTPSNAQARAYAPNLGGEAMAGAGAGDSNPSSATSGGSDGAAAPSSQQDAVAAARSGADPGSPAPPAPPRSRTLRGGSASDSSEEPEGEASARSGEAPAAPGDSSPSIAAPAPGGGGFRSPKAAVGMRRSIESTPPLAEPPAPVAKPKPVSEPVRQVSVEVTPTRSIRRAQVEITLFEGWTFGAGTERSRVLWTGSTRAGQPIRVQVGLKALRAGVPERAARVRLLDATQSPKREVAGADFVVATNPR